MMRCVDVVFAILSEPTRVHALFRDVFRTFIDNRRMLCKDHARVLVTVDSMKILPPKLAFTGPAHGLVRAIMTIGCKWSWEDEKIHINFPLGEKVEICTPHKAYLSAVVRDACRHTAMTHLQNKVELKDGEPVHVKHFRQDMVGVQGRMDHKATTASSSEKHTSISNGTDLWNTDEEGKFCVPLATACKLGFKSTRRLHTIIAGAIRAPHRLVHTKHCSSAQCTYPQCKGARSDTEHVMWHCPRGASIRNVYLKELEVIMQEVKTKSKYRYNALVELLEVQCFR